MIFSLNESSVIDWIPGRTLYVDAEQIYLSRGNRLLYSTDAGCHWADWVILQRAFPKRIAVYIEPIARLLRLGMHHLVFSGSDGVLVADKDTYNCRAKSLKPLGPLYGSRPMALCATDDGIYYGEYRSNPERSAVHIWRWKQGDSGWIPTRKIIGVRHVHGIFHDPFTHTLWVTTGDDNSEAAIWRTDDNFASLKRVVGGSQQYRAVQLLFTDEHVYFGSDTPDEPNHLYRMDRNGSKLECMASVGGSVFYGTKVGESLFFSTAVEPSAVNKVRYAQVWRSDNGRDWSRFLSFKKDFFPMKYFQYGQVLFPSGPGDGRHLFCTPFATEGHGKSVIIDLKKNSFSIK